MAEGDPSLGWHWFQGTVGITDEVYIPSLGNKAMTFTRPKLILMYGSEPIGCFELNQAMLAEKVVAFLNSQRIKPF